MGKKKESISVEECYLLTLVLSEKSSTEVLLFKTKPDTLTFDRSSNGFSSICLRTFFEKKKASVIEKFDLLTLVLSERVVPKYFSFRS